MRIKYFLGEISSERILFDTIQDTMLNFLLSSSIVLNRIELKTQFGSNNITAS